MNVYENPKKKEKIQDQEIKEEVEESKKRYEAPQEVEGKRQNFKG